ncbi:hypothetical protein F0562_006437 [Nyssa sinensis]|uniref:Uncharacterized protein n=1 Tax=Nyssa sinensis TaxID=561372 RepID=A0A5J5APY2_9ASTE|nr:hypothetical protein F0562_006437 [Nyssa sinensis]
MQSVATFFSHAMSAIGGDTACPRSASHALNGIKIGDKTLTVRRANQGTTRPKPEQEGVLLHAQQQIAFQPGALPTKFYA